MEMKFRSWRKTPGWTSPSDPRNHSTKAQELPGGPDNRPGGCCEPPASLGKHIAKTIGFMPQSATKHVFRLNTFLPSEQSPCNEALFQSSERNASAGRIEMLCLLKAAALGAVLSMNVLTLSSAPARAGEGLPRSAQMLDANVSYPSV